MTTFKTTDLVKKTSLETEQTATLLSETELDAVTAGAGGPVNPKPPGGMINPQPLPPRHGPTDPRQF
jgi:hypothetical protein